MHKFFPAALFLLAAAPALADGKVFTPVTDPVVKKECGACHMAYPAGLLPPKSWEIMMGDLANHFGENAALDDKTRDHVKAYMVGNAHSSGKWLRGVDAAQPPLRISDLPYFRKEHDERKVGAMKERLGVKTWADCVACHQQADRGYFDDD
jgi:hypothetical protein